MEIDIKKMRQKLKLTQEELANKLGVSFTTLNRWENKHSTPSKLAISRINSFIKENDERDKIC